MGTCSTEELSVYKNLTPWYIIFLDSQTFTQLVKEIPNLFNIIRRFRKAPLELHLTRLNPVYNPTSHFFNIYFGTALSTPGSL